MRNISSNALTKLATDYGTEPYNIIGIQWVKDGQIVYYSDKKITQAEGKILSINAFDDSVQITNSSAATEVEVTLDDTDGSIKGIMDTHDIHLRPCYIYQHFEGLDFSDKFILFQGQISSPLTWKEADRTVTFSVISQLQAQEVGFSPEMGEFANIPDDLIGKPWPMVFGTAVDVACTPITEVIKGTLGDGNGIHDFTIQGQLNALGEQFGFCVAMAEIWFISAAFLYAAGDEEGGNGALDTGNKWTQQAAGIKEQSAPLGAALSQQYQFEFGSMRVLNGHKFPQNKSLTLNVNGAKFTGHFDGDTFHVSAREHPQYHLFQPHIELIPDPGNPQHLVPTLVPGKAGPHLVGGFSGESSEEFIKIPGDRIEGEQAGFFWAEAGSKVVIDGDNPTDVVASITPGTVLRVAAYGSFNGVRTLLTVPARYYTIKHVDYGLPSGDVTIIHLLNPLSDITLSDGITSAGWEDTVYVTFQADMGSNTVDQIAYIISLYSDFPMDSDSFDHVHDRLENYPSNWALLTQENLVDLLQEVARQARCALWISNGTVYIRYLPEVPDIAETVVEDDINAPDGHGTMEITHTPTEDLVTKYIATWKPSGAQPDNNSLILRSNVSKYGTLPAPNGKEENYFIYNRLDLVRKSATFWLIRMANTWKIMRFQTKIHKLKAESLDALTLDFSHPWIANESVTGLVNSASLDTDRRTIDFEVWTPVRAGEMTAYDFAFPADIDETLIYPTQEDVFNGNAGGGPPFNQSHGQTNSGGSTRDNGDCDPDFDNACHVRPQTYGDRNPSDHSQTGPGSPVYPPIDTGPDQGNPGISTPPYSQDPLTQFGSSPGYIDIHKTPFYDSVTKQHATIDSIIKTAVKSELYLKPAIKVDSTDNQGDFEFVWDSDSAKFAAGEAQLKNS